MIRKPIIKYDVCETGKTKVPLPLANHVKTTRFQGK
jgi:hypothetical protein